MGNWSYKDFLDLWYCLHLLWGPFSASGLAFDLQLIIMLTRMMMLMMILTILIMVMRRTLYSFYAKWWWDWQPVSQPTSWWSNNDDEEKDNASDEEEQQVGGHQELVGGWNQEHQELVGGRHQEHQEHQEFLVGIRNLSLASGTMIRIFSGIAVGHQEHQKLLLDIRNFSNQELMLVIRNCWWNSEVVVWSSDSEPCIIYLYHSAITAP